MFLKSLEMQGFKSFPDKTLLTFGSGITAVVGPNGSGKSNIADAVRWVLGEQSTKSLRGSKMEDVIFSGTGSRKAQGFAQVTLCLDNSDRQLDIDTDEVSVSRRFYRSGESEYKINGKAVRLRDINELFMDTGLGRDGYSIVSQGKIEEMVSAKGSDRREMLEEAAGVSYYRYKRADALKRLDMAQENLVRLNDIFSEIEGRVEPLRRQSEKAQKYLELSNEKRNLEIGIWISSMDSISDELRNHEGKAALAKRRYDDVAASIDENYEKSQELRRRSGEITAEIDEIRRNAASLDEQAASLEAEARVCEGTITNKQELIGRLNEDIEREKLSSQQLDDRIATVQNSILQSEKIKQSAEEQLTGLNSSLSKIRDEGDETASRLLELGSERLSMVSELNNDRLAGTSAQSAINEIEQRVAAADQTILTHQKESEVLAVSLSECEKKIIVARDGVQSLTNSAEGCRMRVSSRSQQLAEKKFALDGAVLESDKLKSRKNVLEEMERSMEGYSGSVQAVMQQSARGMLRGIRGPLSILIKTDALYSQAIETALGGNIQNIVADTERDAKRAINYLKENDIGRATFLPISSIRSRELNEKGLDNCDGYIGIASELVSCDEIYREIVNNQLGKTVVCDDLDNAVELAGKFGYRFKVVTLDGQVVNAGGSMTGGSRIKGSGFLTRRAEIERLGEEMEKISARRASLEEEYNKIDSELGRDKALLDGISADRQRAQETLVKLEGERTRLADLKSSHDTVVESLNQEKITASEKIAALTKTVEDAEQFGASLEAKIAELDARVQELTAGREAIEEKISGINASILDVNAQIIGAQKEIEGYKSIIESCMETKSGREDRLVSLNEEIALTEKEIEELREKIKQHNSEAALLRSKGGSELDRIQVLAARRDEYDSQAADLRNDERDLTDAREKLSGELIRLDEKKSSLKNELETLDNRLFEEYKLSRAQAKGLNIEIGTLTDAKKRLAEIKASIRSLGSVNVGSIDEYKEVSERYFFLKKQISDAENSRKELLKLTDELTESIRERFTRQFAVINQSFSEIFSALFGGGSASMVLEDEGDILESGIEIKAQPPGKNVRSISLLSGGEKGLCAIALLFALLKASPAPFCILDEVEAALDDVNVLRYAQYVRSMSERIQFILITHRRGTMEEADVLYGVTMQEKGVSRLLQLQTAAMARELGLE